METEQETLTNGEVEEDMLIDGTNFGIDILRIIKEVQSQHGLRHGDYQRYHGYCNRRIKRLRKVLGFKMGDKKRVIPKIITEVQVSDSRYLLLLIVQVERSWSYAMKLKQEANSVPRKKHHMLRRLKQAVSSANQLNEICQAMEKVDAKTKLEAQAYSCYINGIYCFEQQNWTQAMELFGKTKTIYEKLCETMSKDDAIVYEQMNEDISPNIRYCAYNIGDQSAMDELLQIRASGKQDVLLADKLDSLVVQVKEQKATSMSEVSWKKYQIPIKNNKIRVFFISLKAFEKEIDLDKWTRQEKLDMYDNFLGECKDALVSAKEDIKNDKQQDVNVLSDLDLIQSYLNYLCVVKTIRRNLLLAEDLKSRKPNNHSKSLGQKSEPIPGQAGDNTQKKVRHSDFVRLYDIILQNLMEIPTLKGLTDDGELSEAMYGQEQAFRALKCFYIAEAYSDMAKWKEAMALYEQVLTYSNKAMNVVKNLDSNAEETFVNKEEIEELRNGIALNKYQVHAAAVMQASELDKLQVGLEDNATLEDTDLLFDNLDKYHSNVGTALGIGIPMSQKKFDLSQKMTSSFPPPFTPVPCKPLFFDLALNHVTFPSLEDKLATTNQKQGISGYIKSLWGWGGKR